MSFDAAATSAGSSEAGGVSDRFSSSVCCAPEGLPWRVSSARRSVRRLRLVLPLLEGLLRAARSASTAVSRCCQLIRVASLSRPRGRSACVAASSPCWDFTASGMSRVRRPKRSARALASSRLFWISRALVYSSVSRVLTGASSDSSWGSRLQPGLDGGGRPGSHDEGPRQRDRPSLPVRGLRAVRGGATRRAASSAAARWRGGDA